MKIHCLLLTLAGLATSFTLPTFAQQREPTPSESAPNAMPTRTLGDHFSPKANAVEVVIGVKGGVYEPEGTATSEMTKDANGMWSDHMSGPTTIEFEGQLKQANIQHVYTVLPGTHSMFVWRPALSNFLQEIFKH